MIPKPSIHPLADKHLRELRERFGVEPSLEEALWIVQLCDRVLNPVSGERLDLIGIPARVGVSDEWLWPVSIGAALWYRHLACAWWDGDPDALFKALAFALAHARDKETLRACRTRETAADYIFAWGLSLTCERAELEAAVDAVLPPGRPEPAGKRKAKTGETDWSAIAGQIEAVTGMPADHWIWGVSREETLRAWHRANQVLAARGGYGEDGAESPEDAAVRDLAAGKLAIVEAHRAREAAHE